MKIDMFYKYFKQEIFFTKFDETLGSIAHDTKLRYSI